MGTTRGYGLVELMLVVLIASVVIGGVLVYGGRAMKASNATEWAEAAQRMIQSVREGNKDGNSLYTGLTEQVARTNGWVPDLMWRSSGTGSGMVPWNGTWTLRGRPQNRPMQAPLQLVVTYGAEDADVCVSVTQALRRMLRDIQKVSGQQQPPIANPTPAQVVAACRSQGGPVSIVYGFAY